jgi:NTP pyrophosphatase (non-canonical NTP hydrolase)
VHGSEYRVREGVLQGHRELEKAATTIEGLQSQVRQLKAAKGFDIGLEQRLAYLTSEVGEVATEVLKLSKDAKSSNGNMSTGEIQAVKKNLGMEIYDVMWNLVDLADMAGVDLESTFQEKASLNQGREW